MFDGAKMQHGIWYDPKQRSPASTLRGVAFVDEVLLSLGPRPTGNTEQIAGEAAMWAAALINPMPSLGIAPEIRHVVLAAAIQNASASEKIAIVADAIAESMCVMKANAGTGTGI